MGDVRYCEVAQWREDSDSSDWCEVKTRATDWREVSQRPGHLSFGTERHDSRFAEAYRAAPSLALRKRFESLMNKWRDETVYQSSVSAIVSHPAYLQIIAMGEPAVPLIIDELRRRSGLWFWALSAITGENPIDPSDAGKISQMRTAWLHWGEARGIAIGGPD